MKAIAAGITLALTLTIAACSSGDDGSSSKSTGAPRTSSTTTAPAPTTTTAPEPKLSEPAATAVACWRGDEQNVTTCLQAWADVYPISGDAPADDAVRTALGALDGCTSSHGLSPAITRNPFPFAACATETQAAIAAVTARG